MNKTLYLPDDEAETWERARRLAGDRLSPIVLTTLKQFIAKREAEKAGFERIEVKFDDSEDHEIPKIKAFHGKWIYSPKEPLRLTDEDGENSDVFCVATTAKGNIVVYLWHERHHPEYESTYGKKFKIYPSFEQAACDDEINYAIRQALRKRGVPVEELDI